MKIKCKGIFFSFTGSLCHLVFLIIALVLYRGDKLGSMTSYLGAIDSNESRIFFILSCLSWGLLSPFFWRSLNIILEEEKTRIGSILGLISGIGWVVTALIDTKTDGSTHFAFYCIAIFFGLSAMTVYIIKLWIHGNYNRKLIYEFIFGAAVLAISVIIILIVWFSGNIPIITGITQKIGIFTMIITFLIQNIYMIKKFVVSET